MDILIISLLILLNGFFALSEIALVSSKRNRLEQRLTEGSHGAKVALKLLDNAGNFLSAIQVGITLIGIVTGVFGGMSLADDVAPLFRSIAFMKEYADQIALVLTIMVITYFSIVIGELVPKTVALSNPEKIAVRIAPVINYFSITFYPFVQLLSVSTNLVNKLFRIKEASHQITEAELRQMIMTASTEGVIEKLQKKIHENIFYFADKKAKHIMTHRTDVEWVDVLKPPAVLREEVLNAHHSKLVCGKGSLDHFSGILNVRDYYKQLLSTSYINLNSLITEPLIIPENLDAQKVIELFRHKQIHFCCVVNEYGGFEGVITLHDIVENIVGQIPDEGEAYEPEVFVREDNSLLVSGDAPIETLSEFIPEFSVDFEHLDYSTVAGFILHQLDTIPKVGDKFDYLHYTFEIIDIDGPKIDKILIKKTGLHAPTP